MKYALVVVDVQRNFWAACDPATLRAIRREVSEAREQGCPVILLEMNAPKGRWYPGTQQCITELLDGYPLVERRRKDRSDGSLLVVYACHQRGWQPQRFRIVGVNTEICVLKTALGLADLRPFHQIDVVQDACHTDGYADCWHLFDAPNIAVTGRCEVPTSTCEHVKSVR